ncbi:MAG: hypothetical protein HQ478_07040 [Chloroflexi bacterium]|nr:hypothetical protein [Chloroflexota bacterium]
MNRPERQPANDKNLAFFETVLRGHDQVIEFIAVSRTLYSIKRIQNPNTLRVFVTDSYSVGLLEATELIDQITGLDGIVTISNWNGYTSDAKSYCEGQGVGLFVIKEFMGALSNPKFI